MLYIIFIDQMHPTVYSSDSIIDYIGLVVFYTLHIPDIGILVKAIASYWYTSTLSLIISRGTHVLPLFSMLPIP